MFQVSAGEKLGMVGPIIYIYIYFFFFKTFFIGFMEIVSVLFHFSVHLLNFYNRGKNLGMVGKPETHI